MVLGQAGTDVIIGGPGDDSLTGSGGRDRYDAGPGNDFIVAHDGVSERVNCGAGFDRVYPDRGRVRDRLIGCERVIR